MCAHPPATSIKGRIPSASQFVCEEAEAAGGRRSLVAGMQFTGRADGVSLLSLREESGPIKSS
jgi:hypothetical protein